MSIWFFPLCVFVAVYGINVSLIIGVVHMRTSQGDEFSEKDYWQLLSNSIYATVANTCMMVVCLYSESARSIFMSDGSMFGVITWFYVFAVSLALFYLWRLKKIHKN